jgi:Phage head-tail joining protein
MRTRVTIEHVTVPGDDYRNTQEEWGPFVENVCCEAVIEAGGEGAVDQQNTAKNVWTLATHWTPKLGQVTALMRVALADGRRLPIRSAINEGLANRKMILSCEEIT